MTNSLTHNQFGEDFNLVAVFGHYANGRTAIQMIDREMGEPFATVTVNLVDAPDLGENEVYVKGWAENERIVARLVEAGWLVDTGRTVPSGYVVANVMTMAGDLLNVFQHQGSLMSGEITCTCGYTTGHFAYAADADEEYGKHLQSVGAL